MSSLNISAVHENLNLLYLKVSVSEDSDLIGFLRLLSNQICRDHHYRSGLVKRVTDTLCYHPAIFLSYAYMLLSSNGVGIKPFPAATKPVRTSDFAAGQGMNLGKPP